MLQTIINDKQFLIHVASEIVVICGLSYFFNQKTKNCMTHIANLSSRLEEQEEIIQQHELLIKQLVESINKLSQQLEYVSQQKLPKSLPPKPSTNKMLKNIPVKNRVKHKKPVEEEPPKDTKSVSFEKEIEERFVELDSDSDSDSDNSILDLDEEISEELKDLDYVEEIDLKKQQ